MSEVFAHAIYFLCQIYNPRYSNSANLLAVMRPGKIDNRPDRHDARRINFLVRHIIMTLDVIDADGLGDSRLLIEIEQVALQTRVIDDPAKIAFEMAVIHDIEPDQGAKQSPIGLDDSLLEQIAAVR